MGFGSPSLKGKALQWLAQREHSRAELQAKLLHHVRKLEHKTAARLLDEADGDATSGNAVDSAYGTARGSCGRLVAGPAHAPIEGNAEGQAAGPAESARAHFAGERAKITQVLDDLAAAGLQSDIRTAQSVSRSKGSRYGVHRLKQHLQAKGLAAELVAHTVGEARGSEFERALDIWRRRYGEPAQDPTERMRQIRFLTARGFDSDIVRRVVRGALDTD